MTVKNETSQPLDLLLDVRRGKPRTLGAQIEEQLRAAIRGGALRAGTAIPSTRDLARQLGVSRRVVIDAYGQLAAEGYLSLRQGARPRIAACALPAVPAHPQPAELAAAPRYDFRPCNPDVSEFPRSAWLRSLRHAVTTASDADLGYGDPLGAVELRRTLADYLGRARGVVAQADCVAVSNGYTQSLGLICGVLADAGATRVAFENPSNPEDRDSIRRAGLEPVPVAVDDEGISVEQLRLAGVDAVLVTPAHQHPTGVVMTSARRAELLAWLRERRAFAIEDDYDAEYRYDRAGVGALQGLDPDRVIYAGSASKTFAPALRLGWLVLPRELVDPFRAAKQYSDRGTAAIDQLAFADFLARGELDRHLRRMRGRYRARRDALIDALADALPQAGIAGVAAGLHATVRLPVEYDEQEIRERAALRRIAVETIGEYTAGDALGPPTLLLGYAKMSEPAIRAGVAELAAAINPPRRGRPPSAEAANASGPAADR